MIRELINKFNRSLSERMVAPRRRHTAPVKVWFEPDVSSERARELARSACILGETIDVSRTGVGFLVPAIRFKEKYLVGQERTLNVEIDLPGGRVCMKAIGRRYERVGIHVSTERYLVGVHILEMDAHNRESYDTFVKNGSRKVRSAAAGALELGID